MGSAETVEQSWARLETQWQACIRQAVTSFGARGLPVGAVVADASGVIATGRNRVYDPPGGSDPLQQTPLAHAEMNALAGVDPSVELERCALWTTHSPCSMCSAAADFVGVGTVRYLAADPSDPLASDALDVDQVWACALNVLFLHNVAWVGGRDNSIVLRNEDAEPEVTSLALALADGRVLIDRLSVVEPVELLAPIWNDLVETSAQRSRSGDERR